MFANRPSRRREVAEELMYGGGREKKSKRAKHGKSVEQLAAEEPEVRKVEKFKKGGKHKNYRDESDDFFKAFGVDDGAGSSSQHGVSNLPPLSLFPATSESVFKNWEELLGSREALKRRLDTIAAIHGWESQSLRTGFLGGIEPAALIQSLRSEISALDPAADDLEKAGLLLELRAKREQLESISEERDRMAEDMLELREDQFEARALLAGQSDELDRLRRLNLERSQAEDGANGARATAAGATLGLSARFRGLLRPSADPGAGGMAAPVDDLSIFQLVLARNQASEGRRVVDALERLKLPDEASMGTRELACWRENKKTIVNSLQTLSSQIYSARARIVYELIQNADDCTYAPVDDDGVPAQLEPRSLYIEASEDALVAYHNETGFQPKDLYAMCQVGESSKAKGSGKIGRKGIGFKSVFQITDTPLIVSPPFQFCFDTAARGIFGYIVPSWVEHPVDLIPSRHHALLGRLSTGAGTGTGADGAASTSAASTGTLLVCPLAPRVRGLEIMRDLGFDGLALAFLKNLEQITFVSVSPSSRAAEAEAGDRVAAAQRSAETAISAGHTSTREHRIERSPVFEHDHNAPDQASALGGALLKGLRVVRHALDHVSIIERVESTADGSVPKETRRHYRLHKYTLHQFKDGAAEAPAGRAAALTTISLAFPVGADSSPQRSVDGELIFAFLPVTAAGFGFGIHADFELVASRQDVSDSHSGNHVLLGRVPRLFVHAILADPALGEDAFPTYLPDVESVRRDRSGGGRKWSTLAMALHRETTAFMMIPTEGGERVKRRYAVLRPPHLASSLVSSSLLKAVTGGEKHFAHPDAVIDMGLLSCLEPCPVDILLDCIRVALDRLARAARGEAGRAEACGGASVDAEGTRGYEADERDDDDGGIASAKKGKKPKKKLLRDREATVATSGAPCVSGTVLLDIWRYLAAELCSYAQQGERGQASLRLLVDAIIGGLPSSSTTDPSPPLPLRIFPVRGSTALRTHSEHGVPLCLGLSSALTGQSTSIARLAERIVPCVDMGRLQGVDGIEKAMHLLRLGEAAQADLVQQLHTCFRFGLAATVDPQLWWDSFRYTVSLGHPHGLVEFMPGVAIALPVMDGRVVSSRDVLRLTITLPCLLGVRRKHSASAKCTLALPPSVAASWGARLRWELMMVEAFGVSFPKADAERIPMAAFGCELLQAVAEARSAGHGTTLEALVDLLEVYERRMGAVLPLLRMAMQTSSFPEECLLEKRTQLHSLSRSCSPRYVDELLEFTAITLADACFHDAQQLLDEQLGLLRLRPVPETEAVPDEHRATAEDDWLALVREHDDESVAGDNDCEDSTWEVLFRLLGFRHAFDLNQCPRLLYTDLGPALADGTSAIAPRVKPFVRELAWGAMAGAIVNEGRSSGCDLWPLICSAGGVWLESGFVPLERCVWRIGDGQLAAMLQQVGCRRGGVVALEPFLNDLAKIGSTDVMIDPQLIPALGHCCFHGMAADQATPLPFPTEFKMMVDHVIPWLLERDCVNSDWDPTVGLSGEITACYAAVLAAPPPDKRWELPVLSADVQLTRIVMDRNFNRGLVHEAARLVVMPDPTMWPQGTALALRHFGQHCLHPAMVPLLASIAERQSVGLETPRDFIQRHFKACLRRSAADSEMGVGVASDSVDGGSELVWSLISELYERPLDTSVASSAASSDVDSLGVPACFTTTDHWEVLLWAAITCATEWHLMQSGSAHGASRYLETLERVRQLVPFVEVLADGGERWSFLATRQARHSSSADGDASPSSVLLLRTLFGFDLWGNLDGLQLRDRAPSLTAVLPTRVLTTCTAPPSSRTSLSTPGRPRTRHPLRRALEIEAERLASSASTPSSPSTSSALPRFPEAFERSSLTLIWEWFLLEIAGAVPPTVLWATVHEPIVQTARSQVRYTLDLLRQTHARQATESGSVSASGGEGSSGDGSRSCSGSVGCPNPMEVALLDYVTETTQVEVLIDEMDAEDEARRAAAAREAEARRRAAEARRSEEIAARNRERERERVRLMQSAQQQQQQQRPQQEQEPTPRPQERQRREQEHPQPVGEGERQETTQRHGRRRVPPPQSVSGGRTDVDAAREQRRAAEMAQMHAQIDRAQAELELERRLREDELNAPDDAAGASDAAAATAAAPIGVRALPVPTLYGLSNTFRRMMSGDLGGGGAGGDGAVRRQAPTLRESEVRGKLARFLAGMRAFERQQSLQGGRDDAEPMPAVLSEFIVWAGNTLAGDSVSSGARREADSACVHGGSVSVDEAARRYVNASASASASGLTHSSGDDAEEEDCCCICQEGLADTQVYADLGEPLETSCGHRFHAVCYARLMEASGEYDPVCPMCRSGNLSARFPTAPAK